MEKNKSTKNTQPYKIHVMPPCITDEDITALFNGIISVVKKKIELEKNAETINLNVNLNNLSKQLKEKNSEIIRLKNEILYLKNKLHENGIND